MVSLYCNDTSVRLKLFGIVGCEKGVEYVMHDSHSTPLVGRLYTTTGFVDLILF
jgi:hypothetical protein